MSAIEQLVEQVAQRQATMGVSDRTFASDHLGMSNSLWSGIKAGRREVTPFALKAILALYPDLSEQVEAAWVALLHTDAPASLTEVVA